MALFPEREKRPSSPEGVRQTPEGVSVAEDIEKKEGVRPRPHDFTAQVKQNGKPLIQTPQTKKVTIKLPADQTQLTTWSKGKSTESLTWMAKFWLRVLKKATHFGWSVVKRN